MDRSPVAQSIDASPHYDRFATTPEYAPLRETYEDGGWSALEGALARLPQDLLPDALASFGEVAGVEEALESAVAAYPRSSMARTALAHRYVNLAWEERATHSRPATAEQFEGFLARLRRAEQLLIGVCAENSEFAPAWSLRVNTARGLELGESEARRRYQRFAALCPSELGTQVQMLWCLLPQWFGSVDAAAAFARECMESAPAGSPSKAVIAAFHIEMWVRAGADGGKYLARPSVRVELRRAAREYLANCPEALDPIAVAAHSMFALAFWAGDNLADAAKHVVAARGRATRYPWSYARGGEARLSDIYRTIGVMDDEDETRQGMQG